MPLTLTILNMKLLYFLWLPVVAACLPSARTADSRLPSLPTPSMKAECRQGESPVACEEALYRK